MIIKCNTTNNRETVEPKLGLQNYLALRKCTTGNHKELLAKNRCEM